MRKTYITTMPDHIGAFLLASKCLAGRGINITRVSYNKAVDSHTLFIDAEGDPEQLAAADEELAGIGYLHGSGDSHVILLEFLLPDVPGSVTAVLELIAQFRFNISYISSQENDTEFQRFKMGLLVDDPASLVTFIDRARELCEVAVIDYNRSEKIFDNSVFYQSFVNSLIEAGGISPDSRDELLINANLAMQVLDEAGGSPHRTFDSISKFAAMLAGCRGEAFSPRVTRHAIGEDSEMIVIEPPCGSNTMILQSGGELLFIDTGYAYYREEMLRLVRELVPEFDTMKKRVLVTHADVDHCGLLPLFDEIIASEKTAACLRAEASGEDGFREKNYLHKPYIRICKTLTEYQPPDASRITVPWPDFTPEFGALWQIGFFRHGELTFEVYEGRGGHLPGEIVLIDYAHRIAITGDIYVNLGGMTSEQKQYNQYAPILMTSVDTDPKLCAAERAAVMQRLGAGQWRIFGAHGGAKEYEPGTK
ncbi:MAG: MBL fold metallo-hydrolase [Ruminococcaceae bacterium]|nr:MBL fold metallo-hydrolase [Oscillospiraceae bacterium]